MEFRLTPEQETFRGEVQQFLKENLPPDWEGADAFEDTDKAFDFGKAFNKKLAPHKWVAPAWPQEYGGAGLTLWEQVIFNEEMAYTRAPNVNLFGVGLVGPTLILFGTDEQKQQHLKGIASGDVYWCQGYSEPNAGSDLASLTTRAVEDGDDFVVNGQKIWTTSAHRADWMILLARTDRDAPKHKGISYFLVDMKLSGITVRPLINMADSRDFSEVFFEDVRVPKSCLLGEKNRGWYMAATTLDFERSSVTGSAAIRRTLEELIDFVRGEGSTLVCGSARNGLADRWIEVEMSRFLSYRVVSLQEKGMVPNYEASIVKVYNSELTQRVAQTGMEMMGLYGQLDSKSKHARLRGRVEAMYVGSAGATIAAGTSEIQRNIIAMRGLGLPRG
jgi:alkylation response protein AidB-like acyl-CoA dehydrogenase